MKAAYEAALVSRATARSIARLYAMEGNDAYVYEDPFAGPRDPKTGQVEGRWRVETGLPGKLEHQLPGLEVFTSRGEPTIVEKLPKEPFRPLEPLTRGVVQRIEEALARERGRAEFSSPDAQRPPDVPLVRCVHQAAEVLGAFEDMDKALSRIPFDDDEFVMAVSTTKIAFDNLCKCWSP